MLKYYNNTTKTLTIPHDFNEKLKDIPDDTKIIIFSQNYKKLEISSFNQEIKENILPNSLHTLTFGITFNQEIKENVLPNGLYSLTFGSWFMQEIKENVLPETLHTLTFGEEYNQEIKNNVLPNSLHTLTFGNWYNQEIKENVLPNGIHTLSFGWCFNQEIKENVLPKSIKKINLFSHCNLINNLPLWIEEVCIQFGSDEFNKEITNLPITLEKITIEDEKFLKYITKIPFGCKLYIINYPLNN
jgi:hypothetical protein